MVDKYKTFYDERRQETYGISDQIQKAEHHSFYAELNDFIKNYDLKNKRCLEIGSAYGTFQDMVEDYHGIDIADSLAKYYHKPYVAVKGVKYPFKDNMFDAIWTRAVFEHIPNLQEALMELTRLLKPGGVILFAPAWQCRPWAAQGYEVRSYKDFSWKGKLVKISIPIRNSVFWRAIFVMPKRFFWHLCYILGHRHIEIKYKKLKANYDVFWQSDSDACNHIDPHDAILWFESQGFKCLSHPMHFSAFFVRTGGIIFRKNN
jgi:SAM-dependent methyltransferase